MKYFAILVDKNGLTKEVEIEGPVPRVIVPIINRITYSDLPIRPIIESKYFYRDTFLLISDDMKCWTIYNEE